MPESDPTVELDRRFSSAGATARPWSERKAGSEPAKGVQGARPGPGDEGSMG
jgi:hypothetical protein